MGEKRRAGGVIKREDVMKKDDDGRPSLVVGTLVDLGQGHPRSGGDGDPSDPTDGSGRGGLHPLEPGADSASGRGRVERVVVVGRRRSGRSVGVDPGRVTDRVVVVQGRGGPEPVGRRAELRGRGGGRVGVDLPRLGLALLEQGPQGRVVDPLGSTGLGEHQPDGSGQLDGKVVRDVVENHTERGGFDIVEETKDDPVTQPLGVVTLLRRLERVASEVGGEGPADEVGDGLGEAEEVQQDEEGGTVCEHDESATTTYTLRARRRALT